MVLDGSRGLLFSCGRCRREVLTRWSSCGFPCRRAEAVGSLRLGESDVEGSGPKWCPAGARPARSPVRRVRGFRPGVGSDVVGCERAVRRRTLRWGGGGAEPGEDVTQMPLRGEEVCAGRCDGEDPDGFVARASLGRASTSSFRVPVNDPRNTATRGSPRPRRARVRRRRHPRVRPGVGVVSGTSRSTAQPGCRARTSSSTRRERERACPAASGSRNGEKVMSQSLPVTAAGRLRA